MVHLSYGGLKLFTFYPFFKIDDGMHLIITEILNFLTCKSQKFKLTDCRELGLYILEYSVFQVIRIILQFYRNLLTNHSAPRKAAELMIQGKVQVTT